MKNLMFGVLAVGLALSTSAFTNASKLTGAPTPREYTNVNVLVPNSTDPNDYQYIPLAGCTNDINVTCKASWLQPDASLPAAESQPTGTFIGKTVSGVSILP